MSRKPIPSVDPKGKEWPSFSAMCRAWGIDATTVRSALARGKTLEQALTHTGYESSRPEVPPERRTDHHGKTYPTIKAMCIEWGIQEPVYLTRRRLKWTVQRALETPVKRRSEPATDHQGNVYPSVQAMCEAWGVVPGTYRRRREMGLDVQTALEAPSLSCIPTRVDGKDYPSLAAAAARAHAVDPTVVGARLQKGVPVEEAFRPPEPHIIRGPNGRVYTSLDELCTAYGISYSTYRRNIGEGMSLLDALTTKRGPARRPLPSVDHTGRKFPTFAAMCEEWGRMPMTVRYRLRIGWTLERALTRKGRLE